MIKRFTLLVLLFVVAGCGSTKLVSSWKQSDYAGATLKRVLVLAVSKDELQRRVYEDSFVEKLKIDGIEAIASHTLVPSLAKDKEQNIKLIRAAVVDVAADSVLVATLVGVERDERYVESPLIYVPVRGGAYGMHDYYFRSYEVIQQPGYVMTTTTVKLKTTLFSAKTAEMLWAGDTHSFNPDSASVVIDENIDLISTAIKKAGLL